MQQLRRRLDAHRAAHLPLTNHIQTHHGSGQAGLIPRETKQGIDKLNHLFKIHVALALRKVDVAVRVPVRPLRPKPNNYRRQDQDGKLPTKLTLSGVLPQGRTRSPSRPGRARTRCSAATCRARSTDPQLQLQVGKQPCSKPRYQPVSTTCGSTPHARASALVHTGTRTGRALTGQREVELLASVQQVAVRPHLHAPRVVRGDSRALLRVRLRAVARRVRNNEHLQETASKSSHGQLSALVHSRRATR